MKQPFPDDALDDRLGFVGTAGAGKSYNAMGRVERLLNKRARVCCIDPLGVFWGLRLSSDGKTESGFDIPIFGGPHGDLPLTEHSGALIGETVAGMAESCIIDLSEIGTKAGERRFMLHFLTALYRKSTNEPLHLIIDESDMFAPQKLTDKDGDAAKLLGMMETVVRRGRIKGFIPWLITQRPAVIAKDVLSQVDGLIAFKLTSSQDRDALSAWVEGSADKEDWKTMRASLPAMERGQGVVWIPGRGVMETVNFPPKFTFDSSKTPKRGETKRTTSLKPLDLGELKERLSTIETETKANDPKTLKAEISALKQQLASKPAANGIDKDAVRQAEAAAYARGKTDGYSDALNGIAAESAGVIRALENARSAAAQIEQWSKQVPLPFQSRAAAAVPRAAAAPRSPVVPTAAPAADGLTAPQRRIMMSLAFWKSIGHEAPTREQVAAVAGYRPGSGNFNNLIGGLGSMGQTTVPSPGRLSINVEFEGMSPDQANDKLWSVLDNPQKRLVVAAQAAAGDLSRDELAVNAGYAAGSGNFNNITGSLTSMDILQRTGSGRIALSDWAREVLQ